MTRFDLPLPDVPGIAMLVSALACVACFVASRVLMARLERKKQHYELIRVRKGARASGTLLLAQCLVWLFTTSPNMASISVPGSAVMGYQEIARVLIPPPTLALTRWTSIAVVVAHVTMFASLLLWLRGRTAQPAGQTCARCGYILVPSPSAWCPECGTDTDALSRAPRRATITAMLAMAIAITALLHRFVPLPFLVEGAGGGSRRWSLDDSGIVTARSSHVVMRTIVGTNPQWAAPFAASFGWRGSDSLIQFSVFGTPDQIELSLAGGTLFETSNHTNVAPFDRNGAAAVVQRSGPATKPEDVALIAGAIIELPATTFGVFTPGVTRPHWTFPALTTLAAAWTLAAGTVLLVGSRLRQSQASQPETRAVVSPAR